MIKEIISSYKHELAEQFGPFLGISMTNIVPFLLGLTRNPLVAWMKEESKRIAQEHDVDWRDVFLAQYIYDIIQLYGDEEPSACTTGSIRIGGKTYFIRFMDWAFPEGIGQATVTDSIGNFKSVGFPGFLGVITAVGQGWAVALNQSPGRNFDLFGVPACIFCRRFCEEMDARVSERSSLVRLVPSIMRKLRREGLKPMSNFMLHIVMKNHHGRLEVIAKRKYTFTVTSTVEPLATANHFEVATDLNPPLEWEENGIDWIADTKDRQDKMLSLLNRLHRYKRKSFSQIIEHIGKPIRNEHTANITMTELTSRSITTVIP